MRLSSDEIEYLARKIVKVLAGEGHIEAESPDRLTEDLTRLLADELALEDRLNEEVREVLIQHSSEMQRSNITYTEMFKMVKRKLAKEKGIVL